MQITYKRGAEKVQIQVKKCKDFDRKVKCFMTIMESDRIKKYMMTGFDLHAKRSLEITLGMDQKPVKAFAMDLQAAANLLNENHIIIPPRVN